MCIYICFQKSFVSEPVGDYTDPFWCKSWTASFMSNLKRKSCFCIWKRFTVSCQWALSSVVAAPILQLLFWNKVIGGKREGLWVYHCKPEVLIYSAASPHGECLCAFDEGGACQCICALMENTLINSESWNHILFLSMTHTK